MLMRSLDQLGDEIAELSVHLDAATARLLDLIREFDIREGWNNGFRSCAAWLAWRVGLDLGAARERVRVARALEELAAARRGARARRALLRQGPGADPRRHAGDRGATACSRPRRHRRARRAHRPGLAPRGPSGRGPEAKRTPRPSGAPRVSRCGRYGCGSRAAGARSWRGAHAGAGRRARCPAGQGGDARRRERLRGNAPFAQQQADALALVAETALHHGIDPGTPGERYQVVVHVDAAVLADAEAPGQSVLEGGARVPAETSQRLACDASRVVMRHDADGGIVEVGARTRTIPTAMRRALAYRDHGCRFPGCDLPFGQAHHIQHWAQGGPTTLSNLVLLCRRHHRAVHEEGFQVADSRMASSSSAGQTAVCCGSSTASEDTPDAAAAIRARTPRPEYPSTRTRPHQDGTGNPLTSAGQLTCYIHWPTRYERVRAGHAARSPVANGGRAQALIGHSAP